MQRCTGVIASNGARTLGSTGTIESAYQYDDEGRLTRQTGKRPRTLLWDAQGRLASLTQGGHTETYAYDPSDYRIQRSGGSASQASAGMPTGTPSGPLDYYLEGEHLDSVEDANRQPRETYFRGSTTIRPFSLLRITDGKVVNLYVLFIGLLQLSVKRA